MKKEALRRGAELAPSSLTLGMSSGRGVVSMRACWLNLGRQLAYEARKSRQRRKYLGWRDDMVSLRCQWRAVCSQGELEMELLVTEVAGLGSSGNWQGLRLAVPESCGTIDNAACRTTGRPLSFSALQQHLARPAQPSHRTTCRLIKLPCCFLSACAAPKALHRVQARAKTNS